MTSNNDLDFTIKLQTTKKSSNINYLGMREMQERAYEKRTSQYLLIKSPPASGKSRALMFLALDKLHKQNIKKAIIVVPERSIARSFKDTDLTEHGYYFDWHIEPENNLCFQDESKQQSTGTIQHFKNFLDVHNHTKILLCTHATLRLAFKELKDENFNNCLLAIDEAHHMSDNDNNVLGGVLTGIMENSTAHIILMTGSFFRGDSVAVLSADRENQFEKVTYNYYEQLNGYQYLKSFSIKYPFYNGRYIDVLPEVLDLNKKTIIHIPSVNSRESTKDKYSEVDEILDVIGDMQERIENTNISMVKTKSGKILKVADLVNENNREETLKYLQNINDIDDMDIIIALSMAKEGFDWEYCECALTIGYRGSLTEVIQIIGRCTRDSYNKNTATFINLISQPSAEDDDVTNAINDILKAITLSLLMEQVLTPSWKFKPKELDDDTPPRPGEIFIKGLKPINSLKVKHILETDLIEIKEAILKNSNIKKSLLPESPIEYKEVSKVLIPKLIEEKYPGLTEAEIDELAENIIVDTFTKTAKIIEQGDKRIINMANRLIDVDDLNIELISSINPFHSSYSIFSKQLDSKMLLAIKNMVTKSNNEVDMSDERAMILWPDVLDFRRRHDRQPDITSPNEKEKRLAIALKVIRQRHQAQNKNKDQDHD